MGLKLDNPPFKFDLNMCECLSARALNKAQTHTTLQLYIKLLLFLSRLTLLSQLRFLLLLFLSRFCLLFLLLPISYSNTRASPISLHQDCRSFKCRSIDHLTILFSPSLFLRGTRQLTSRAYTAGVTVLKVGRRGTSQITSRNFSALSSASAASAAPLHEHLTTHQEYILPNKNLQV